MKILIVKLSSLGDIVHSLAVLSLLNQLEPKPVIDWLVADSFASLLEPQAGLHLIHRVARKNPRALLDKALELRKEKYDLLIDLQGLIKTALAARIINAQSTLGFANPRENLASLFYTHKIDVTNIPHVVDKNIQLVQRFLGLTASQINFGIAAKGQSLTNNICVIPSTTWESKLWPTDYWIRLLSKFPKANIFLLGSQADLALLEAIRLSVPNAQIIANKKLTELPDFFMTMQYIIGVDTGPLHLAAATCYGQKSAARIVGIYGPTSASRTGPYGYEYLSYDELFNSKASCKRTLRHDGGSMSRIQPDAVYNKINEFTINFN